MIKSSLETITPPEHDTLPIECPTHCEAEASLSSQYGSLITDLYDTIIDDTIYESIKISVMIA